MYTSALFGVYRCFAGMRWHVLMYCCILSTWAPVVKAEQAQVAELLDGISSSLAKGSDSLQQGAYQDFSTSLQQSTYGLAALAEVFLPLDKRLRRALEKQADISQDIAKVQTNPNQPAAVEGTLSDLRFNAEQTKIAATALSADQQQQQDIRKDLKQAHQSQTQAKVELVQGKHGSALRQSRAAEDALRRALAKLSQNSPEQQNSAPQNNDPQDDQRSPQGEENLNSEQEHGTRENENDVPQAEPSPADASNTTDSEQKDQSQSNSQQDDTEQAADEADKTISEERRLTAEEAAQELEKLQQAKAADIQQREEALGLAPQRSNRVPVAKDW